MCPLLLVWALAPTQAHCVGQRAPCGLCPKFLLGRCCGASGDSVASSKGISAAGSLDGVMEHLSPYLGASPSSHNGACLYHWHMSSLIQTGRPGLGKQLGYGVHFPGPAHLGQKGIDLQNVEQSSETRPLKNDSEKYAFVLSNRQRGKITQPGLLNGKSICPEPGEVA